MSKAVDEALNRLRKVCLALPDTTEKEAWGDPTFRVRGKKMFAQVSNNHHGDGIVAVWFKAPLGFAAARVAEDPKRFYVPPYVGHKGWIGVRLDVKVDWADLASIAEESYRMTAPKQLIARLDDDRVRKPSSR